MVVAEDAGGKASGPPSPAQLSFADAVGGKKPTPYEIKSFAGASRTNLAGTGRCVQISTKRGDPWIDFPQEVVNVAALPYRFSLVGKFSQGRPQMEEIRKFFQHLDFQKVPTIGSLDRRHILIQFHEEADFQRLWARPVWQINRFPMRTFRWTQDFRVDRESPIAPVWFSLPNLPIQFFHKDLLFQIASCLGKAICVDAATASRIRPSVARICVEVNLSNPSPKGIWLTVDSAQAFWQKIDAEDRPYYCEFCFKQGHEASHCRLKHPELGNKGKRQYTDGVGATGKETRRMVAEIPGKTEEHTGGEKEVWRQKTNHRTHMEATNQNFKGAKEDEIGDNRQLDKERKKANDGTAFAAADIHFIGKETENKDYVDEDDGDEASDDDDETGDEDSDDEEIEAAANAVNSSVGEEVASARNNKSEEMMRGRNYDESSKLVDNMMTIMEMGHKPGPSPKQHECFSTNFGDNETLLAKNGGKLIVEMGPLPMNPMLLPGPSNALTFPMVNVDGRSQMLREEETVDNVHHQLKNTGPTLRQHDLALAMEPVWSSDKSPREEENECQDNQRVFVAEMSPTPTEARLHLSPRRATGRGGYKRQLGVQTRSMTGCGASSSQFSIND